jgi:hypothetical protein
MKRIFCVITRISKSAENEIEFFVSKSSQDCLHFSKLQNPEKAEAINKQTKSTK